MTATPDPDFRERLGAIRDMLDDLVSTTSEQWNRAGPNDCHYCHKPIEPYDTRVGFGGGDAHPACSDDWFRREGLDPATTRAVGSNMRRDEIDVMVCNLREALPGREEELKVAGAQLLSSRIGAQRLDAFKTFKDLMWLGQPVNPLTLPFLDALEVAANVEYPDE